MYFCQMEGFNGSNQDKMSSQFRVSLGDAIELKKLGFKWEECMGSPYKKYADEDFYRIRYYYHHNGEEIPAPSIGQAARWVQNEYGICVNPQSIGDNQNGEPQWVYTYRFPDFWRRLGNRVFKYHDDEVFEIDRQRYMIHELIKLIKEKNESKRWAEKRDKIIRLERDMFKKLYKE